MLKVYHFDINGTIIEVNSTDSASVEDMASEAFSRSINPEGEIHKKGEITYYTFIKAIHPNYKTKIYKFLDVFPQHREKYNKLVVALKAGLFESFLKFVDKEFKDNKSLLMLRTFGKDREFVTSMLESYGMKFLSCKSEELNDKLYKDCHEKGVHIMVQDDYHRWNNNERKVESGKEVKYFEGIVQYAFDDNLCMNCEHGVKFYQVNTLRAALEEDYYTSMISDEL